MKVTILCALVLMAALFLIIWVAVALVQEKMLFITAPKDIQAAAKEHEERFPGPKRKKLIAKAMSRSLEDIDRILYPDVIKNRLGEINRSFELEGAFVYGQNCGEICRAFQKRIEGKALSGNRQEGITI